MVVPRASLVQAFLDIFWKVGMNGEKENDRGYFALIRNICKYYLEIFARLF